jgi:hypothetical protein
LLPNVGLGEFLCGHCQRRGGIDRTIFVAVSISLAKILSFEHLTGRPLGSLILLVAILITASLCLVPGQGAGVTGIEIIVIGLVVWGWVFKTDTRMLKTALPEHKKYYRQNLFFSQLAILPYILSGIVLITHGFVGLYCLIPGILFSFIKALVDAWVLLVEIHR